MRSLLLVLFLFGALYCSAQHAPKDKTNSNKIPDRKNIGAGKPKIFTRTSARSIQAAPSLKTVNAETAFRKSAGDTLRFAYPGGDLVAVVLVKAQKNPFVTVMNLRVINYENAFMRLTRSTLNNKLQYRGMVHHPSYADALVLKSDSGNEYFESTEQSQVINE